MVEFTTINCEGEAVHRVFDTVEEMRADWVSEDGTTLPSLDDELVSATINDANIDGASFADLAVALRLDKDDMSNVEYTKRYCGDYTVACIDNKTGSLCLADVINDEHYNTENCAVKLFVCEIDNEDGHRDFVVGEEEFNSRFINFELRAE